MQGLILTNQVPHGSTLLDPAGFFQERRIVPVVLLEAFPGGATECRISRSRTDLRRRFYIT